MTNDMKQKLFAIVALLCTLTGVIQAATTWTITNSNNVFTITRSGDLTQTETVICRTVSLTAYAGQHFTELNLRSVNSQSRYGDEDIDDLGLQYGGGGSESAR